jgi:hypothetical protein
LILIAMSAPPNRSRMRGSRRLRLRCALWSIDPREHAAWAKALVATREAWERSYERRTCPRPELALHTVGEDRRELVIRE